MSDYADAVRDWNPVAEVEPLRFPPAVPERHAALAVPRPAAMVQPEPQVYQPVPFEAGRPNPWQDPWVVRPIAGGACAALCGLGVDLVGQGIRTAGPYLWAAAAFMGALAAVIAFAKGHGAAQQSGGTTVTFNGGRNKVGRIG
jgi:hypothetical protein